MVKTFTIGELAKEAGVSVRTIRFYIDEGLIPPPEVRGRNTLYGEEYLDRIELIRRLKEAYLPLREIQQRLQRLSDAAVRELLGKEGQTEPDVPIPSQHVEKTSEPKTTSSRPINQTSKTAESAIEYITRLLDIHGMPSRDLNQPQPAPAAKSFGLGIDQSNPPPVTPSSAPPLTPQTTWQRIILSPGIELHISQSIRNEKRTETQRLIQMAQQLFESKRA